MSTIKIKRSGVSAQTPSSLEHGELALNYADGKLFYKDATNAIAEIGAGGGSGGGGSSLGLIEKQYEFDGVLSANTGDARLYLPDSCSSVDIKMYLKTASVSGSVDVDYKINDSVNTSLSIAQGATSTSATSSTAISTGSFVTFDITSAGSGAEDLYVLLSFTRS